MRLLLIRHAQTVANDQGRWQGHTDTPLTGRGERQAQCLATTLAAERDRDPASWGDPVLYASSLGRAQATAGWIARALALPVISRDALREYDVGVFSGKSWAEIETDHPAIARHWQQNRDWSAVPDAEPLADRVQRGECMIGELLAKHADHQTVLCVSHGGFLQYLIAAVLGTRRIWGVRPGNTAVFEFTLTRAGHADDRQSASGLSPYECRIHRFNDTAHLAPLSAS
ncbi:histidine phosphatase family protein [Spiribacter vilamensis]|uniref:2,3-bisphosphoglycerate-dependent phosphoglycerate mutase/probable phosphoglycerate mutase n=1 Tax=Spiribacter vilamensis TaxID=531306 RepID=A0A4Q8CZ60_9GAMM|nr:histidine phosphatase family protein [Spiribacter vilamensis]RZU98308.1 2,3-bisphosphoglycerate-dependent phosphoglycerate mutase/probable phosphoglycerate mutase [Spiribacter vilamensis]TVO60802.1 histidine phosphatase family protein [Spiribacter vilamensis]